MSSARSGLGFALSMAGMMACAGTSGGIHARFGWSEQGLRVVDVPSDGPADRAGLAPDDRIVAIDGVPVSLLTMTEAVERLRGPIGSRVRIEILRAGETHVVDIERAGYVKR